MLETKATVYQCCDINLRAALSGGGGRMSTHGLVGGARARSMLLAALIVIMIAKGTYAVPLAFEASGPRNRLCYQFHACYM